MWEYKGESYFKNGLGFCLQRLENECVEGEHTHDFIELVYTVRGTRRHYIDKKPVDTKSGDVLLINYGHTHSYEPGSDAVMYNILLVPEFLDGGLEGCRDAFRLLDRSSFESFKARLDNDACVCTLKGRALRDARSILKALGEEYDSAGKRVGSHEMMRAYMTAFLILVFRELSIIKPEVRSKPHISEEVFEYIKAHSSGKITLDELAGLCHYNSSYFSRVFKRQVGMSVSDYIRATRLENVCRMLESDNNGSIEEIALACGFSDKSAFFREFSASMGMTPGKYRKSKNKTLLTKK
ncbi:MAG: AraC family transcriptional regulator [Clostridia bacterium]|nr:AraC family transcriptional regulator [Clostridia bacterium]